MSDEWTIRTNALPLGDEGSDYHVGYHYHRPGLINDDVIDEGLKPDSKRPPGFFHPSKYPSLPSPFLPRSGASINHFIIDFEFEIDCLDLALIPVRTRPFQLTTPHSIGAETNTFSTRTHRWFYRWTILALSSCFLFAAYFADVMIGSTAPLLSALSPLHLHLWPSRVVLFSSSSSSSLCCVGHLSCARSLRGRL
jgi:hypothetical protein